MEDIQKTTPPYASFGSRFYAYLIDQSVVQGVALAILAPFGMDTINGVVDAYSAMLSMSGGGENSLEAMQNNVMALAGLMMMFAALQFVIGILYGAFMESSAAGATLGKRYCDLRVTDDDGNQISFWAGLLRNAGVSLVGSVLNLDLMIGLLVLPIYLTPLITKKRQTLYDMVAGTVVIRTK